MFVTSRELNDTKPALINGKVVKLLVVINSNKINSSEHIKYISLNVNFDSLEEIKNI